MRFGPVAALLFPAPLLAAAAGGTTAIDNAGNVWRSGEAGFLLTTPSAFQPSAASAVCGTQDLSPFQPPTAITCNHAYLVKQDSAGKVLYATYLGGSSQDGATALTTDSQGNVYVAGYTYSADFPVTAGAVQSKNAGPTTPAVITDLGAPFGVSHLVPGGDVFVAKFSSSGALLFSTLLGGSSSEVPTLIAVDGSGSLYLAGPTLSSDFPLTADATASPHSGYFFAHLNPTGTALVYSTYSIAPILAFDVDNRGRAYLTGNDSSGRPYVTAVDTSTGAVQGPTELAGLAGAGVAIAVTAQNLFLGVSPAPQPFSFFSYPSAPSYSLGASSFVELPLDASRILAETDVAPSTFDAVLLDASGNAYAFGHGTGKIPATTPQVLSAPCSANPASFVLESNPAGTILAATYFRQGDDTAVSITAPGHLLNYRIASATTVALDLTSQPASLFGCPENLAAGVVGPGLAPGEIILLTGTGLGPAQGVGAVPNAAGFYPTSLGGVQVLINAVAVPLLFVEANEIHAVAPFSLPTTSAIQVQYGTASAPPLDATGASVNPGIFNVNGQGAIVNQDGTVNTPANPAPLGSIVSVYCTGTGYLENPLPDGEVTPTPPPFDVTEPPDPQLTFAGVAGVTLWSGSAPGLIAGVTQINVQLPAALPADANLAAVPVILNTSGALSPAVFLSVKR